MAGTHEYGARFLLQRASASAETVSYRAQIERPGSCVHSFELQVALETGEWALSERVDTPAGIEAPDPWMVDWLQTLAQRLVRQGLRSGTWPRKSKQWKGPPD